MSEIKKEDEECSCSTSDSESETSSDEDLSLALAPDPKVVRSNSIKNTIYSASTAAASNRSPLVRPATVATGGSIENGSAVPYSPNKIQPFSEVIYFIRIHICDCILCNHK